MQVRFKRWVQPIIMDILLEIINTELISLMGHSSSRHSVRIALIQEINTLVN